MKTIALIALLVLGGCTPQIELDPVKVQAVISAEHQKLFELATAHNALVERFTVIEQKVLNAKQDVNGKLIIKGATNGNSAAKTDSGKAAQGDTAKPVGTATSQGSNAAGGTNPGR